MRPLPLAAAVALGACAAATGGGALTVDGRGARSHFAPVPPELAAEVPSDRLERMLLDAVTAAARAAGRPPPDPDPRLAAVCRVLARAEAGGLPGLELQEFLLSHHGLGEPPPELLALRVDLGDAEIRDRIAADLPRALAGGGYRRVGVAVARRWLERSVVLALQRVDVELLPVPRQLPPDGSAFLGGRLLHGLAAPRVLVARPRGDVGELPVRGGPESFQTTFRCDDGPGRYQVEVAATGPAGKTIVANFPVFCGTAPPARFAEGAAARAETEDPARAEALVLAAINRDRALLGLLALDGDEALARVARAHSEDMAARETVGHVSPASGDAGSRVRRAGVRALLVLENVARARSVAEAQRSFMTSPGHRANVLDRAVRRVGVGVAVRRRDGRPPVLYVTQLFAR